jgi:hypothetical protein
VLLEPGKAPRDVVTYGLLTSDLGQATTHEGVRTLGRTVGFEWLADLGERLTGQKSLLGMHLSLLRLRPGATLVPEVELIVDAEDGEPRLSTKVLPWGDVAPGNATLSLFARDHGLEIGRWHNSATGGLGASLYETAKKRQRIPTAYFAEMARALASVEPPVPLHIRPLSAARERHWSYRYTNLLERTLLELFELATLAPRLRLCVSCGRPFVPSQRDGENGCPNNLWDAHTGRLVASCPSHDTSDPEETRRREYRRLWTRYKRSLEQFGEANARTKQRKRDLDEWMVANQRTVGRRPTPLPDRNHGLTEAEG